MDPEYQAQLQRLQQFRRSLAEQSGQNAVNTTQVVASNQRNGHWGNDAERDILGGKVENEPVLDPMIYPGLYSPSGFDIMGILVRVRSRPNPAVDIGNIDSSVALVLCDTALPDAPIVYCSEPFEVLTGYNSSEILGTNCRFLQHPHPSTLNNVTGQSEVYQRNENPRAKIREKIQKTEEVQVRLVNYTKGGVKFFNLLTIIPIAWEEREIGKRYMVGFQAQDNTHFT